MTRKRALAAAVAATFVGTGLPAQSSIIEISLEASGFYGYSGPDLTGETPPQDPLVASFTIDTNGSRDVPDSIGIGHTGSDEEGDPGVEYEVLNIYTTPVAADVAIAGYAYPLSDLATYIGYVNGTLAQVDLSGRAMPADPPRCGAVGDPAPPPPCPPSLFTHATTNDFLLGIHFPTLASPDGYPPTLSYTTEDTLGYFAPLAMRIALAIDGGEPIEFVQLPPHEPVEGAVACEAARADGAGGLAGGAKPGVVLCGAAADADARSAGAAEPVLRDARVRRVPAADAGLGVDMRLSTAFGTHRLDARKVERLLLAAAKGGSSDVAAPGAAAEDALRCAKVKPSPGAHRFAGMRGVLARDGDGRLARYDVRKPARLCVGPEGLGSDAGSLLCYRARRVGAAREGGERVWVAHALGVERLAVKRTRELCVPVEPAE